MFKATKWKTPFSVLSTAFVITLAGIAPSKADIVMTWQDVGGSLNLTIDGTWSDWESTSTMTERDDVLFGVNGNTSFAFDLSRDGLGDENLSGDPIGSSSLLNVLSGSGSVSGPDVSFAAATGTRYNIEWLNVGGFLALTAGVGQTEEFFVDETFDLGAGYSVTDGTRVFGNSNFVGGDTLTMNFVGPAAIPVPASLPLLLGAFAGLGYMRRKQRAASL